MNLVILTPEKKVYEGSITSVKVPGTSGEFEVLKGHAAIVSSLAEGAVRVIGENGKQLKYTIERGFIEVLNDEVALLVRGLQVVE